MLEFNARFGDPEAQGIAPLVKGGLLTHMREIAEDSKRPSLPECASSASVVVVLASKGYPSNPSTGDRITIRKLSQDNVVLFHAGTARDEEQTMTSGGRVLGVTAWAKDLRAARDAAYAAVERIHFDGAHYRRDIGVKALQ